MNEEEFILYHKVLDKMKKHKAKYPLLYNNDKYQFIKKFEHKISNDATKGVMLFKLGNKYITSIFIDNGYDSIITNLHGQVASSEEEINTSFDKLVGYVKTNDVMTILENVNFDKKIYQTLIK